MSSKSTKTELNVSYYLRDQFRSGLPLLDPTNLETTQEYYLLENLSSSLLRKEKSESGTLRNTLVKEYRIESDRIVFDIRDDALWSDGSAIKCEEVVSSLQYSILNMSRHIVAIKNQRINCIGEKQLSVTTLKNTPQNILFELGLADLAIMKLSEAKTPRFDITSGAYYLDTINKDYPYVELCSNPYYFSTNNNRPHIVRLFDARELNKRGLSITPGEIIPGYGMIDFMAPQGWSFAPATSRAIENAPKKIEGMPSLIHFLHYLSGNKKLLPELGVAFYDVLKLIAPPKNTNYYYTLIPPSFAGNIQTNPILDTSPSGKKEMKVYIKLASGHRYIMEWFEKIKLALLNYNIHITFDDYDSKKNYDLILASTTFKGNMSDPTGSWAFLLHEVNGPLKAVSSEFRELLKQTTLTAHAEKKYEHLNSIHETVLKKGYAFPFIIEPMHFLMSNRVLRTNTNLFDMRVRFYEFEVE